MQKVVYTREFLRSIHWTKNVPTHGFVRKILNDTYARVQWVGNPHETLVCRDTIEPAPNE